MKQKSILFILLLLVGCTTLTAQNQTRRNYIQRYQEIAIAEMERTGIPASIKLAQAILESGDGRSPLARNANNHFGIKCGGHWKGKTYYIKDDDHNKWGKLIESCFRVFGSPEASFIAHSDFLMDPRKVKRYGFLFNYSNTAYKKWAKGLRKAGYASNPKYPKLLIDIIEENQLFRFDEMTVSGKRDKYTDIDVDVVDEPVKNNQQSDLKYQTIYFRNDVKMVFAKAGDTPTAIARRFKVSLKRLLKYNEINSGTIFKEADRVYLQPKRSRFRGKQKHHIVKSGETMYDIAQLYGVKTSKLYKRNKMVVGQQPATGAKIALRKKAARPPKLRSNTQRPTRKPLPKSPTKRAKPTPKKTTPPLAKNKPNVNKPKKTPSPATSKVIHIVKKGETLYRISKQHGVAVEKLKQLNRLESNSISIGQRLIIR